MTESRRDILISMIVDGHAGAEEWNELAALAESDPAVWRDVAEAQRDHARLGRLMDTAAAVADEVPIAPRPAVVSRRVGAARLRFDTWTRWAGWAVAAVVVLTWAIGVRTTPRADGPRTVGPASLAGVPAGGVSPETRDAGIVPVSTARDAFAAYLEKGRAEGLVLSDQPRRVLLETRPDPSGEGYELIYLQQVMEKTVVPNLFRVTGQDERGRPSLVRYEAPVGDPM